MVDYFCYDGNKDGCTVFSKEVGIWSSSHCLLGRDCNKLNTSVSDVGWKVLSDAGGGEGGESSVVEGISGGESNVVLELSG